MQLQIHDTSDWAFDINPLYYWQHRGGWAMAVDK